MNDMPSFFKVLITSDFTRQLRIPPAFLQDCDSALPAKVKLRISSGRTWDVRVELTKKGLLSFTHGWQSFAADVGLRFAEFLIFTFDCDHTFQVSVYQTNGCLKTFPCNSQDLDSDSDQDGSEAPIDGGDSESESDQSSPLYFKKKLKKHQLSRFHIPKSFWMAADLKGKESVRLEYGDKQGREYVVKLENAHRLWFRVEITRGWGEFRKANGIVLGKTYSFEFIPSRNVIQIKEVKKWK